MDETQKRWRVKTQATITKVYFVDAADAKAAEAEAILAQPDHEEEDNEETMSIIEVARKEAKGRVG